MHVRGFFLLVLNFSLLVASEMNPETARPRLKQGAFQIYTGEGKGKSTASMGLMLRALGCGFRVYYLRMMKPRWKTGELAICPTLHPNLTYKNVEQDWILIEEQEYSGTRGSDEGCALPSDGRTRPSHREFGVRSGDR